MDTTLECRICGRKIIPGDMKDHVLQEHGMDWKTYYEVVKYGTIPVAECWNCGERREYVTPYLGEYKLPCRSCTDKDTLRVRTLETVGEFLGEVEKNLILQDILTTPWWIQSSLTHNYEFLIGFLGSTQQYTKYTYREIDFVPGNPKEISRRNLFALLVETHSLPHPGKTQGGYRVTLGTGRKATLLFPEECKYDERHHSRYSIFNMSPYTRSTKKLRFSGTQDCIKFWPGESIFKLVDESGERIDSSDLTDGEKKEVLLYILRIKPLWEIYRRVILEIMKYSSSVTDLTVIQNTISIPGDGPRFTITWFKEDNSNICVI